MSSNTHDTSMLDLFRIEAETNAAVLSDGLLMLEKTPGETKQIEPLMRAAHSIKGAARIVQLNIAVTLAHAMEDCFVAVQENALTLNTTHIDVLLQGVDIFTGLSKVSEAEIEGWLSGHSKEIEALAAEIAAFSSTPPEAVEPAPSQSDGHPISDNDEAFRADASMLDLFRTELETHSAVLNDGLLVLEKNPRATDRIEPLMRAAHSIKGAARILQLTDAGTLAHAMEDCFVAVQEGACALDTPRIDILLRGVDIFTGLSTVAEGEIEDRLSGQHNDIEALAAEIRALSTTGKKPEKKRSLKPPPTPKRQSGASAKQHDQKPVPEPQKGPSEAKDSVVRVTTENLNRLMGLAGELLVEARWLAPFSKSLFQLKKRQTELYDICGTLRESLDGTGVDTRIEGCLLDAREKMNDCTQMIAGRINDFEIFARRMAKLSNRFHREVIISRMRPFSDGVQGFPRMVRDLAKKLGKKVNLEIIGKNTEVDRDILDRLEAPLNHILRNAVDHGIEMPDDRLRAGKPEEGTVKLEAVHRSGMLSITVSDDGRGIDPEMVRRKVIDRNLASKEMAGQMTQNELMEFLFLPGFSTAMDVTEISGRGVGLDVVQNMIHDVSGIVRVSTEPGKSVTFHLQLPITLSVIRTLLVEIAGEAYAFPLSRIDRCLHINRDDVKVVEDRQFITVAGTNIGLVDAHQVLELESAYTHKEEIPVIIIGEQIGRYGLVVNRFLGERELVVQPLDSRLGKIPDISAAAIMSDGSPVLIVDVEDMVRSIDNLLTGSRLRKVGQYAYQESAGRPKRVLVVDDSITVRETERKILENGGYDVDVAVNGMDGWNAVRSGNYDLVVSDIDMPRMTGFELTELIKQDPVLKALPVMIVSYKEREEDKKRGLTAGANYYLTKSSFHDETFINAVIDLIGKARA